MPTHITRVAVPRLSWLTFASDAAIIALWGTGLLLIAVFAAAMERRRHNRDRIGQPDRVGWMPWTGVFFVSLVVGAGLLVAALPGLLGG